MKRTLQVFNFSITNQGQGSCDIHIDGDIVDASTQQIMQEWWGDDTSVSFKSFRNQVSSSNASVYNVYINSGGGSLTEAMAMHDLIVDLQAKGKVVNTIGRGIVASAATYILMAGKNPEMSANSWLMIHNVSGAVWGNVNEVENYAGTLRQFNDKARDFYANYTGIRKEDITKMMNAESWMPANEAKEKGFIKSISNAADFTNSIKPENWHFQNTSVLNAYNKAVKNPTPENNSQSFIQQQFDDMKKFFTDIVNAVRGVKPADNASHAEVLNQIATALSPLEKADEEIKTEVSNQVSEVFKGEAFTTAVNNAVTEAVKPLNQSISELQTANKELEKEITNLKGAPTHSADKDAVQPIGSFN